MLEKLIKASVDYLIRSRVISEDDRDVYEYGFHSLYNNVIDITSIVVISILLKQVPQTIFYHISFIVLRNIAGGYHAKTHLQCFVMSTTIWLLSLWGISNTTSPVVCICLAGLSVLFIWVKAPVEHINSPLSTEKRQRMKLLSRIISVIYFVAILFISITSKEHLWIASSLVYGAVSHTLLIILALLESRFSTE